MELRTERFILHDHRQRLARSVAGGEACKLRLGVRHLCVEKFKITVKISVFRLHLHSGQSVIALAEFRIVEPDMVERQMILFIINRGIAVARGVLIIEEGIFLTRWYLPAIIELLELAAGQRAEQIACFSVDKWNVFWLVIWIIEGYRSFP